MLKHAFDLQDAINILQSKKCMEDADRITAADWAKIEKAALILEPLYEATNEICGAKYITGSLVITLSKSLIAWYADKLKTTVREDEFSYLITHSLHHYLLSYFRNVEDVRELALAALLDPRFKKECFRSPDKARKASSWLENEINASKRFLTASANLVAPSLSASEPIKKSLLWGKFDEDMAQKKHRVEPVHDDAKVEIKMYLGLGTIERHEDPVQWWQKTGNGLFPDLFPLTLKYLCIQGSSILSDRLFSNAGLIISQRRVVFLMTMLVWWSCFKNICTPAPATTRLGCGATLKYISSSIVPSLILFTPRSLL